MAESFLDLIARLRGLGPFGDERGPSVMDGYSPYGDREVIRGAAKTLAEQTIDAPHRVINASMPGMLVKALLTRGENPLPVPSESPELQGYGEAYDFGRVLPDALLGALALKPRGVPSAARRAPANQAGAINPKEFGLKTNPDGTVTLYHGTSKASAGEIVKDNLLKSAGEPDVYLSSSKSPGYGDATVSVDVNPARLFVDDAFPDGRFDFRLPTKTKVAPVSNARLTTEFEIAHDVAQRNAAKPISKGGLGLPADNTAMDRARAMGFDTDAYHGTTNDFPAFGGSRPTYAAEEPRIADIYANATGRHMALRETNASPNVMPLLLGGRARTVSDLGPGGGAGNHGWFADNLAESLGVPRTRTQVNELPKHGIDRLKVTDFADLGGIQTQHMIPAGSPFIRSRFAAFDPMRSNESDLLAGIAGTGLLTPLLLRYLRGEETQ